MKRSCHLEYVLKTVFAATIVVGCGGSAPSMLYVPEHPVIFDQCPTALADIDPVNRSLAGFLKTLQDFKWKLNKILPEQGIVNATACVTGGNHTTECVTMTFAVDKEGRVLGYAEPSNPITREMEDATTRWMKNLDQRFPTYRCMIRPLVVEALGMQGIELASPASPQASPETSPILLSEPVSSEPQSTDETSSTVQ